MLDEQIIEPIGYDFGFTRRTFVQALGTGLLIFVAAPSAGAQDRPGEAGQSSRRSGRDRGGERVPLSARLHIGKDGSITVMTGKVEGGQGARAEITQAAA